MPNMTQQIILKNLFCAKNAARKTRSNIGEMTDYFESRPKLEILCKGYSL